MSKRVHVSLDLETGGTGTNAALRAIGAVSFDIVTGAIIDRFYVNVDMEDHIQVGGVADARTLDWWSKQSEAAQLALLVEPVKGIHHALHDFTSWMPPGACLWGNGSNFDNRILREAYSLAGVSCPWHWIADRDLRTLVHTANLLGLGRPEVERVGTHHNAVDDAEFQANLTVALMKVIGGPEL